MSTQEPDAQTELDDQRRDWGEDRTQRAVRKLIAEQADRDAKIRDEIVALRQRVKALEDRLGPP